MRDSKDEHAEETKPVMRWGRLVKRYVKRANQLQVILEKLDNKLDHMGRTLFECTSVSEGSKDDQSDGSRNVQIVDESWKLQD